MESADLVSRSRPKQRLTDAERSQLRLWARQRASPHRLVVRSRILLLVSQGLSVREIAQSLRVAQGTVRLWAGRFTDGGLAAIASEAPGRGRPAGIPRSVRLAVLEATRDLVDEGLTVRAVAKSHRESDVGVASLAAIRVALDVRARPG